MPTNERRAEYFGITVEQLQRIDAEFAENTPRVQAAKRALAADLMPMLETDDPSPEAVDRFQHSQTYLDFIRYREVELWTAADVKRWGVAYIREVIRRVGEYPRIPGCDHPDQPGVTNLRRAAFGLALFPPETKTHLAECPACQAHAAIYREVVETDRRGTR